MEILFFFLLPNNFHFLLPNYFSYLSWEGELLNLTWNDTRSDAEKIPNTIWQWDDATWVMSACFIIFGKKTHYDQNVSRGQKLFFHHFILGLNDSSFVFFLPFMMLPLIILANF